MTDQSHLSLTPCLTPCLQEILQELKRRNEELRTWTKILEDLSKALEGQPSAPPPASTSEEPL